MDESKIYRNNSNLWGRIDYLGMCPYVLENVSTGEKVFARKLNTHEWAIAYEEFKKSTNILVEHLHPAAKKLLEEGIALRVFGMNILLAQEFKRQGKAYDQKYVEFDEIFHYIEAMEGLNK